MRQNSSTEKRKNKEKIRQKRKRERKRERVTERERDRGREREREKERERERGKEREMMKCMTRTYSPALLNLRVLEHIDIGLLSNLKTRHNTKQRFLNDDDEIQRWYKEGNIEKMKMK
jgi:hypothetical protein